MYNFRGNTRTSGEDARKEGGQTFGAGSRTTIAVLIAIKNPALDGSSCRIHYRDIGDYLTREQKLSIIGESTLESVPWIDIHPNKKGDWINQRTQSFGKFPAIANKKALPGEVTAFSVSSGGLKSNRDAWVYNFSRHALSVNMGRMIDFYNSQVNVVAVAQYGRESAGGN